MTIAVRMKPSVARSAAVRGRIRELDKIAGQAASPETSSLLASRPGNSVHLFAQSSMGRGVAARQSLGLAQGQSRVGKWQQIDRRRKSRIQGIASGARLNPNADGSQQFDIPVEPTLI
jgi:hypothetical protein